MEVIRGSRIDIRAVLQKCNQDRQRGQPSVVKTQPRCFLLCSHLITYLVFTLELDSSVSFYPLSFHSVIRRNDFERSRKCFILFSRVEKLF